ncbi:MAG: hypothetical protein HDT14_02400 [Oscillibacter sp.]|nr:hypothetical protein [Oscillibacter sp.]
MKSSSTWRFVLKIVGASLAAAGLICLLIGFWDKLTAHTAAVKGKLSGKCFCRCSEFDDYDDDLLCE